MVVEKFHFVQWGFYLSLSIYCNNDCIQRVLHWAGLQRCGTELFVWSCCCCYLLWLDSACLLEL